MFKTASRKMCGIRLGAGTTLKQQKESQNRFNGIEYSGYKKRRVITTPIVVKKTPKVVIRRIKDSGIEIRKVDGITIVELEPSSLNFKQKIKTSDNNRNIIKSTSKRKNKKSKNSAILEIHKKKKKSGQLLSSQKHLNALLLNAVPGSTCPKCRKRFMGFDRDRMGSLTTKCCNYRAFSQ